MPILKIFNTLEIEAFEAPPLFNSLERKKFFTLPTQLQQLSHSFSTPTNQVCFIVTAGYFRARYQFFGSHFHPADVRFVATRLEVNEAEVQPQAYHKQTVARHQQILLEFFGYRRFNDDSRRLLLRELVALASAHMRPKMMLLEAMQWLIRHRIVLPGYTTLAGVIGLAITRHKRHLLTLVTTHLTERQQQRLDSLLEQTADPETGASAFPAHRYRLTLLKKFHHSTKPARIKANVTDWCLLEELYQEVESVIHALGLSHDALSYYAHAVIKAEIFQVTRRAAADRYLHVLAFIAHQTFRVQDLLIDTLLSCVQTTLNTTQREHKEQYYQGRLQRHHLMTDLVTDVEQYLLAPFTMIQQIIADPTLSAAEQVVRIARVLEEREPHYQHLAAQVQTLQQTGGTLEPDQEYYALLGKHSLRLQHRVDDIVRLARFDPQSSASALLKALTSYQQRKGSWDRRMPIDFLSAQEQALVVTPDGSLQVSLYKVLLFIHTANAIKAGTLNLQLSHKYRSLEEYLIPQAQWTTKRTEYLQRANLLRFMHGPLTLRDLQRTVDEQYRQTNEHYLAGHNPLLKFRPNQTFYVTTPKEAEEETAVSLRTFFPERKYISLLEVLATVQQATRFLDAFTHWQHTRQRRQRPPEKTFLAGIVGLGCDIGEKKIAQISRQINEHELEHTLNWYFSVPNLLAANDRILSVLDQLELPALYQRDAQHVHTSSDGQKFEVAVDSLTARHSFKYFGQNKGVSVYSFIDERHFLFHSTVISSAEREAAYVIDGLLHNDVVQSDLHSTDTHGYTEVIFGTMFLLGFTFAPRLPHLHRQQRYAFTKRKGYTDKGYVILPDAAINTELIMSHWEAILRFIATIKLKHTSASQLFKRLNSYAKQHPLYQALKEFGKIPKTLFLLRYIDDPLFRQAIEKQLNKIESAQKFSRAVSFGHNQEILQADKVEQDLAEGCRRLIKNAIICWNYLFLTQRLQDTQTDEQREALLIAIQHGSVVSWQHVNLHGEYDFSDEKLRDSVGLNLREILGFQRGKIREEHIRKSLQHRTEL